MATRRLSKITANLPSKGHPTTNTLTHGKHFKVVFTKYTDEDFDVATDKLELEIKSDRPVPKNVIENGISHMCNL